MTQSSAVLDQFLEPVRECLTPELARRLASFRPDERIQVRVDELARRCNEGTLSSSEHAEYESLVEEADMIAGKVSYHSPLGAALMGKKKGDEFSFHTPKGTAKYKILKVE